MSKPATAKTAKKNEFLSSLWKRYHSPKPAASQMDSSAEDVSTQLEILLPACFPSALIEIIGAYATTPLQRSYRSRQLERSPCNEVIQGTYTAFAFRKEDGSVVTWGDKQGGGDSSSVQAKLKNVKVICATTKAFAAIVGEDNKVVTWGDPGLGGDSSSVEAKLVDVVGICATDRAFAALTRDGTVVTWGDPEHLVYGSPLKEVKTISSTAFTFAAVRHDGTVATWGRSPFSLEPRLGVECLTGGGSGFVALLEDGTVQTWGIFVHGAPQGPLTEAIAICTSLTSFAVLKRDGSVACSLPNTWALPVLQLQLRGVRSISATGIAFAALRSDGTVVTWGESGHGGDSCQVKTKLEQVESICGNYGAFAALRSDGTVVTWGVTSMGGDSSSVQSELRGVVAIGASFGAFAARRSDGTVVTWGDPNMGGAFPLKDQ